MVYDHINQLVAVVKFDAEKELRHGFLSSFFLSEETVNGGLEKHRRDLVKIEIRQVLTHSEDPHFYDTSMIGPVITTGFGSYLENIQFE